MKKIQRKDKQGWTVEKAKKILADHVVKTKGEPYPCHDFSLVKLIVLGQWSNVYTTIIPKYFNAWRYVDLMAGSGTSYIKEADCIVAGSVFVAKAFAREPYSSFVVVEKNRERFEALKERAKELGSPCQMFNDNANTVADQIFGNQPEDVHSFVFVDNEGFNVSWRSIDTILKTESDLLINFPTKCFQRTCQERTSGSLNDFYGDSSWRNALVAGEEIDNTKALEIYMEKLRKTFGYYRLKAPYVSSIRIGNQNWFYDLILCCKSGKYTAAWQDLSNKTYWKDPNIPRNACNLLRGKSSILDQFMVPYDEKPADQQPKYKGLLDF